jgi:hypothetical protein
MMIAGLLLYRSSGWRSLATVLFWIGAMGVCGLTLLMPTYQSSGEGTLYRNPTGLLLASGLAAWLCLTLLALGWSTRRERCRLVRLDPHRLLTPPRSWTGIRGSCGLVAAGLLFLVVAGLAAPVELRTGGYRLAALLLGIAAMAGGAAVFFLVAHQWNALLADVAMGLVTLSICALFTVGVPSNPEPLRERFPLLFNAILLALAVMTALWSWLASVWCQQLDNGKPWTTAGHLVAAATDFAFQSAALGILLALLMAAWPLLPGIGVADSSVGRFIFGVGAHLLLMLVLVRCWRRTGRRRFIHGFIFAAASMILFIAVRALHGTA